MIKWSNLYTFESLLIATTQNYTKCLFQKFKTYTSDSNGHILYDWARHNKANVVRLHNQLKNEVFDFQLLNKKILKLGSKVREVYIPTWRDRMVDSMLNVELNRLTDHMQSNDSYAYRLKNAGVDICQSVIAKKLFGYTKPVYIVKRDISNYYPSINKDKLLDKLKLIIDENDYLFKLLYKRIYHKALFNGKTVMDSGVPFGSPLSCYFANWYLNGLDHTMSKFNIHYFRYADDIIFFSDDRKAVIDATSAMDSIVADLGLKYKDKETHNLNICFWGNGDEIFRPAKSFKHLGLKYKDDKKIGIGREKQRKILNIFKRAIARRHKTITRHKNIESRVVEIIKTIKSSIDDNIKPIAIIDYYLKHMTDDNQLKQIDRMVAELVLATATGRGYKRGNFGIISYKRLRELGLMSLRHRQRLLKHGHIESKFFDFRIRGRSKINTKSFTSVTGNQITPVFDNNDR